MKRWAWWREDRLPWMARSGIAIALLFIIVAGASAQAAPSQQSSPQTAPPPLPAGDPVVGKEYFTAVRPFQNGGPPCMACHSIAGIGALGGGALGPDLTRAYSLYGETGLATVLSTIPFPTMNPIFGTAHPLTPEEQAHLRAFLQQASVAERAPETIGLLVLFAIAGTAVIVGGAHLAWRRRLDSVRRPMVAMRRGLRG